MNVNTNHLIETTDFEIPPDGYEPIPESLNRAARRALGNKKEVYISKNSGGKLSKWASKKRRVL